MISERALLHGMIVAGCYLLLLPFQLVIFPSNYYSVRDVIYSGDIKKAMKASAGRLVMVIAIALVFRAAKFSSRQIVAGVTLGSFLCVWPSIYHYQLFVVHRDRVKLMYFLSCVASVAYSGACAYIACHMFIPIVLEGKQYYLLENSGISLAWQLLGLCIPSAVRELLERVEQENPYMDADTFPADLYMTRRKISFESGFVEDYRYQLAAAAEKYQISEQLLERVVMLELINRGSLLERLLERAVVTLLPRVAVRKNLSIGLCQIRIRWAQNYYQEPPLRYMRKMLRPEESILLCAAYLRETLDEWDATWCDETETGLDENDQLSLYIASEYVCGCEKSLRKFALVYMTLIAECNPLESLEESTEGMAEQGCG